MVKILAPVYSSLFFSSSCHLSYCEKNLIKHLKINRFFKKSQTLPDVYPKMNTTSLCVLCGILWTVLSPQRHLCLSACRPPVQLAGPQACDFSAIQLLRSLEQLELHGLSMSLIQSRRYIFFKTP